MDEGQLNDLKQFIAATASQAFATMVTKADLAKLERKIDDLDLKVDTISVTLNERLNERETKLTKLEQQVV